MNGINTTPSLLSGLLTREALCGELKVHERTLLRWEALGQAPRRTQIGKSIFYRRATVEAWLASREQPEEKPSRRRGAR